MNQIIMKKLCIIGILGGLLFGIGDWLVSLLPNYRNESQIYDDWIQMNDLRPALAVYLGCIGALLLIFGFYSWYLAIREKATKLQKICMGIIAFGIIQTPIVHFVIACLKPIAYKVAIQSGAEKEIAIKIMENWNYFTGPIRLFGIVVITLVPSIVMIVFILKEQINCSKWMVICNPLVFTLLSIPVSILLNGTGFEGLAEAFESLGEGFIYLPVYFHWKKQDGIK